MAYLIDSNGYRLIDSEGFALVVPEGLALITDRTAVDLERARELATKASSMTAEELAEWLSGLKGTYNASDFNRVEKAVEYIADRLQTAGWYVAPVVRIDWRMSDYPSASEMRRYLDNVRLIRSTLPVGVPQAPDDMNKLTYTEANTIERILELVDAAITNIMENIYYCGEIICGEV